MKNTTYYTHEEAKTAMLKAVKEGKGFLALKDDPKCPPDMKTKFEHLSKLLSKKVTSIIETNANKGNHHGKA